jgi:hypothetical protein
MLSGYGQKFFSKYGGLLCRRERRLLPTSYPSYNWGVEIAPLLLTNLNRKK